MPLPSADELGKIIYMAEIRHDEQTLTTSLFRRPWNELLPQTRMMYMSAGIAVADRMIQYFQEMPNERIASLERALDAAREERFQAEMRLAIATTRLMNGGK